MGIDTAEIEAITNAIVDELFTNVFGESAQRLVLELPDKKDGGGWCRDSVSSIVAKHLAGECYSEAFSAGFDCGKHGPNDKNSHFSFFESSQMTAAWERGKSEAQAETL